MNVPPTVEWADGIAYRKVNKIEVWGGNSAGSYNFLAKTSVQMDVPVDFTPPLNVRFVKLVVIPEARDSDSAPIGVHKYVREAILKILTGLL